MIIIYTPAGGEREEYDASSLRVSEASIVQRTIDMKWQAILAGLESDDLDAMRGVVWVIKKRSQPSLRFGEFDPGVTEMTSRMDRAEIERWLDSALAKADESEEPLEWEVVEGIISARLDDVAFDPEHARQLLAARAPDPKEDPAPDTVEGPPEMGETEPADSIPSPTSSAPETSTSPSSPTSSTSPQPPLTT